MIELDEAECRVVLYFLKTKAIQEAQRQLRIDGNAFAYEVAKERIYRLYSAVDAGGVLSPREAWELLQVTTDFDTFELQQIRQGLIRGAGLDSDDEQDQPE